MAKSESEKAEEYADRIVHHNVGKTMKPEPELEPEDPEGMIPHN